MRAHERFLKYVSYNTQSDMAIPKSICPTTEGQKELAAELVKEMLGLGIKDAHMDESGIVYGTLEANCDKDTPVFGLVAHMDTTYSVSGANIKPSIIKNYKGGDIVLNAEKGIVMKVSEYESLNDYIGQDLIVTDGTTLLGADDKASIAEILTAVELINKRGLKHGTVKIAFTPDEEIGLRGAERIDIEAFGAKYAYTVDGSKFGKITYETFNGASAAVVVHGVGAHPGRAKNKMKNATLIGIAFNALLPQNETPACTEEREGFQHLISFSGTEGEAKLNYIIREHDKAKFEAKKLTFQKAADYINYLYGEGTLELNVIDTYYNIKEKVEPVMSILGDLEEAMRKAGFEPSYLLFRGSTDGSILSYKGLPCPNISNGGHNSHSIYEYMPIQSLEKTSEILVNLMCK